MRRPLPRLLALLPAALLVLAPAGCQAHKTPIDPAAPELATYIELIMPARVKILEWTKPVSLTGDGVADGLEVIVAAYDAFDDETKVVGTFHFELQSRKLHERIGTRVGFWPVQISSPAAMRAYLDYPSGFYRFPLQLENSPLTPGRYLLTVRLHLPTERRLVDEYEFDYDGGGVPTVRPL